MPALRRDSHGGRQAWTASVRGAAAAQRRCSGWRAPPFGTGPGAARHSARATGVALGGGADQAKLLGRHHHELARGGQRFGDVLARLHLQHRQDRRDARRDHGSLNTSASWSICCGRSDSTPAARARARAAACCSGVARRSAGRQRARRQAPAANSSGWRIGEIGGVEAHAERHARLACFIAFVFGAAQMFDGAALDIVQARRAVLRPCVCRFRTRNALCMRVSSARLKFLNLVDMLQQLRGSS